MGNTTIWVSHRTKELLDILKKEYRATSYDFVVRKMAKDHLDGRIDRIAGTMKLSGFERNHDEFKRGL